MDSDEDRDDQPDAVQPAITVSEKRRTQNSIFDLWLASPTAQAALESEGQTSEPQDSDILSTSALMSKTGSRIINSPRDYQLELFERAKQHNTIAVLDTGSGKTLVAVLLLRWIIDHELERREAGHEQKISFFLVASVFLVHQQFFVLETNLDHNIAKVSGSDGADSWSRAKWSKIFSENKVVICTADILSKALSHSFITMDKINLLIFDEAHHAKKNHTYARIIKDFYLPLSDENSRPRIFSMTASPVDAKTDVIQAAKELETVLHSKIATTDDLGLGVSARKPSEEVVLYNKLSRKADQGPLFPHSPVDSSLLKEVSERYRHITAFAERFKKAKEVQKHLGKWCTDKYLKDSLCEPKLRQYEIKVEKAFKISGEVDEIDKQRRELREAIEFVEKAPLDTTVSEVDLTSKVMMLARYLRAQFERPSSHRCLVFVDRRHTARLLSAFFEKIGTEHLRCASLTGSQAWDELGNTSTLRQQVLVLTKFREGELNCLFTTSVAEEGLDIPNCNLVIRFDLCKTMIQYVQSRGRAREINSKFVHMVDDGSATQKYQLLEVRHYEEVMRAFCCSLPKDRRLMEEDENSLEDLMGKERSFPVYIESSTNAKLTFGNAMVLLANFVAALPNDSGEQVNPTYVVSSRGPKFIAEVVLPGNAPIRSAMSGLCDRKGIAKRSAAFKACTSLRQQQHLDEFLMPKYQKKLANLRNALLAVNTNKTNQYQMRTKPSVWEQGRGTRPTDLWALVVDFSKGLERPHQPLVLLTRTKMPSFPLFPIFLNSGPSTEIITLGSTTSFSVGDQELQKLSKFTFRIFQDVFSKQYEEDATKLSYWLAPASLECQKYDLAKPMGMIDWNMVNTVFETDMYQWSPDMPDANLTNKFLIDKWDGGRKFYSVAVDRKLKPLDPVPENAAKAKHAGNILEYTVSLWRRSRERAEWNPNQPVVVAQKILLRLDLLAPALEKEIQTREKGPAYLCPEPLRISTLHPDFVASCFVWPAVVHRLESYLIALEACSQIGVVCQPEVALAAITKDSDNSGDHDSTERINFQRGMGENYERLEFIGDTFLKMATTISTFVQNPNDNEYAFHVKRMHMLCNKNLFEHAKEGKLYEMIRSMSFSRRLWYPEGLKLLVGKGAGKQGETAKMTHALGAKTIADVCEALIGAAFVTHHKVDERWQEQDWENAVLAVTNLVCSENHTMQSWNDYRLVYEVPAYQTSEATASQRHLVEQVTQEHPYRFRSPPLLRSAFVHPSEPLMYDKVPNYQRLEFLGDALLDMASISHLFYRFPDKDPQWLTEHKMAMVSNKFLGAVCVNIGFHRHLRLTSSMLQSQISTYAKELLSAREVAGDSRDYWTTVRDPPKCLPDIVEAYVGAMFIDSDFDFNTVQAFFDAHIRWFFEHMSVYDTFANNHPCTHLHNLLQTSLGCGDYRLMAKEAPGVVDGLVGGDRKEDVVAVVMVHDRIIAHAKGKSGKYARVRAANAALQELGGLAPYEFRERFGCDCHVKAAGGAEGERTEEQQQQQQQQEGGVAAGPGERRVPVDCGV